MAQQALGAAESLVHGAPRKVAWIVGVLLALAVAVWWLAAPDEPAPPSALVPPVRPVEARPKHQVQPSAEAPERQPPLVPTLLPRLPIAVTGTAGDAPLDLQAFFRFRDETYCGRIDRCPPPHPGGDRDNCLAVMGVGAGLMNRPYVDGVQAGRLVYDGTAAVRCVRHMATTCEVDGPDCQQVFRGQAAAGATCWLDDECASRTCKKPLNPYRSGVCVEGPAERPACERDSDCQAPLHCVDGECQFAADKPGARCRMVCASDDLWCDEGADPPVCRTRLDLGDDCPRGRFACKAGTYCAKTPGGGRCTRQGRDGDSCDPAANSAVDDDCARGQVCVPTPAGGTCRPRQPPGGPCRHDDQCQRLGTYCNGATADRQGRCVFGPAEGEPCLTNAQAPRSGRRCRAPLVCQPERQVCVPTLAEGAACPDGTCGGAGVTLTCVAGTCRRKLGLGEPCSKAEGAPPCGLWLACVDGACVPTAE